MVIFSHPLLATYSVYAYNASIIWLFVNVFMMCKLSNEDKMRTVFKHFMSKDLGLKR